MHPYPPQPDFGLVVGVVAAGRAVEYQPGTLVAGHQGRQVALGIDRAEQAAGRDEAVITEDELEDKRDTSIK